MPRLKTLALVSWKRDGDDKMTAHVQNATCDFTYDLIAARSLIGGWNAYLAVNGTLVHTSEHAGRNEAQLEAQAALKRGIDLREGP